MKNEKLNELYLKLNSLCIFRALLSDSVISRLVKYLKSSENTDTAEKISLYSDFVAALYENNKVSLARHIKMNKVIRADNNPENPRYAHTVDFQKVVGIRTSELAKLEGRDLYEDESGFLCVFVKDGKGGKDTLQRILPEDEEFIRSYFNIGEKEKVFQPIELSNSIDYHHRQTVPSGEKSVCFMPSITEFCYIFILL